MLCSGNTVIIDRRDFLGLLGIAPSALVALPQSASNDTAVFNVLAFGAHGDGNTNDAEAIQRAINTCASAGGGRVVFPPGKTYLSGTISLKSDVTIELQEAATLKASADRDHFRNFGSLVFAKDASNISIRGAGKIDGNFHAYLTDLGEGGYKVTGAFLGPYNPLEAPANRNYPDGRPRMILFVGCKNVRLSEFTVVDAPTWTIHPIGCDGLYVEGVSILNDLRVPNCDGIDVDHCRRVRIADCNIQAGDDCIVLKTSRNFSNYGPTEDVTVTGCTLTSSSAGIKIEPEGEQPIRNAVFSSCVISHSNRGICLLNRDGALIEDLVFSNFVITTELRHSMWWGAGEPVHLSNLPRNASIKTGTVRGLRFSNFLCEGESGLFVHGWKDSPIADVAFEDVRLTVRKTSKYKGGFYDLRPGETYKGLYEHKTAGVYARWASDLALRNVTVQWSPNLPSYYGSALEAEDVTGLELQNFKGGGAHGGVDPARLVNGKSVSE